MTAAARARLLGALAGLGVLALAGCGKKAEPVAPGPAGAIIYPRPYPPPP